MWDTRLWDLRCEIWDTRLLDTRLWDLRCGIWDTRLLDTRMWGFPSLTLSSSFALRQFKQAWLRSAWRRLRAERSNPEHCGGGRCCGDAITSTSSATARVFTIERGWRGWRWFRFPRWRGKRNQPRLSVENRFRKTLHAVGMQPNWIMDAFHTECRDCAGNIFLPKDTFLMECRYRLRRFAIGAPRLSLPFLQCIKSQLVGILRCVEDAYYLHSI